MQCQWGPGFIQLVPRELWGCMASLDAFAPPPTRLSVSGCRLPSGAKGEAEECSKSGGCPSTDNVCRRGGWVWCGHTGVHCSVAREDL